MMARSGFSPPGTRVTAPGAIRRCLACTPTRSFPTARRATRAASRAGFPSIRARISPLNWNALRRPVGAPAGAERLNLETADERKWTQINQLSQAGRADGLHPHQVRRLRSLAPGHRLRSAVKPRLSVTLDV